MRQGAIEITQIRNATLVVQLTDRRFLIDPMFDAAGTRPAVANTANERRNPLVELPTSTAEITAGVEAAFITHLHADHFDAGAVEALSEDLPLFCLPEHADVLRGHGFQCVTPVFESVAWEGITVTRTEGRHGTGEIGQRMAPVCGFAFKAAGSSLYVAGDTIWCDEVAEALRLHGPDVVVVNAGEAKFLEGDPITMDAHDVIEVCRAAPSARVIASHCDAINHCALSRTALRSAALDAGVELDVPEDGETT